MNKSDLSDKIKKRASDLGFISCGISKADFLEEEAPRLENWLNNNYNGKMSYMSNHFDKRLDPRILVDDAKSVITVLINYFPKQDIFQGKNYKISKYAYGQDYHSVVKDRLKQLLGFIEDSVGEVSARLFTDSAPVLDKAWAKRSGLGWIGKHSNLITKQVGSYYFIGEIILDLELAYDTPVNDYCGSCTACIDACPTEAIIKPYVVDGSKCISYLTIELKDEIIPNQFKGKMEGWVFGCDICQDVCPWNRFSQATKIDEFKPLEGIENADLENLSESMFKEIFRKSPIKRTKFQGLNRNINFIK